MFTLFPNSNIFGVLAFKGWMGCCFISFLTVYQSYQDDRRVRIKSSMQWNPFTTEKIFTSWN